MKGGVVRAFLPDGSNAIEAPIGAEEFWRDVRQTMKVALFPVPTVLTLLPDCELGACEVALPQAFASAGVQVGAGGRRVS